MKTAVKVGFDNWQRVFRLSQAKVCEIWFRLDWQEKYLPLFCYLQKNKIEFGLHYWAMIDNKYMPSFLYEEQRLVKENFRLIKKTIDIASHNQAKYVNFHPDCYYKTKLDLEQGTMKVLGLGKPINREKAFTQIAYYLGKLKTYGQEKGVLALLETVPSYNPTNFKNITIDRTPQKSEGLETARFYDLAKLGFDICFDLEHTMSQIESKDKETIFNYTYNAALKLLPRIKLVHLTTKTPPFNGTDCHNGILQEDFRKKDVVPDKKQLIKFLSLFKDKDLWLIPEPHDKMVENYLALTKIVRRIKN